MRTKLEYLRLQQKMSRQVLLYKRINTRTTLISFWCFAFKLDCISVATLSMYFVDWFNLANVKNIMLAFIRIVVYF